MHAANGGTRATSSTRRLVGITHGIGALLILVGGFGMLARIGMKHGEGFPGWLWVKIVVWLFLTAVVRLFLTAVVMLPYRRTALARPAMLVLPLAAGLAVYMALYKPF